MARIGTPFCASYSMGRCVRRRVHIQNVILTADVKGLQALARPDIGSNVCQCKITEVGCTYGKETGSFCDYCNPLNSGGNRCACPCKACDPTQSDWSSSDDGKSLNGSDTHSSDSTIHICRVTSNVSNLLQGTRRVVDGYIVLPFHRVIDPPILLDNTRGGSLCLIVDLGVGLPPSVKHQIQVDLTDSKGSTHAAVTHIEELETLRESAWVDGIAYQIRCTCPPRGLPLSEVICVSVIVAGVRFAVGMNEVHWVQSTTWRCQDKSTSTVPSYRWRGCSLKLHTT